MNFDTILENLPRSATVEVVEDAILIRIDKAAFEALLKFADGFGGHLYGGRRVAA